MKLTPVSSNLGLKIIQLAIVFIWHLNPVATQIVISTSCGSSGNAQCKTLDQVLSNAISDDSYFQLEAGTHVLSKGITVSSINTIILAGQHDSTTIQCSEYLRIENAQNVQIRNIKFPGCNLLLVDITKLDIQNSKFTNNSRCFFEKCNGMLLKQSEFFNNSGRTIIDIRQSKKVQIIESHIKDNKIAGELFMISLSSSTLNVICCNFQGNEMPRQVSAIITTSDHSEIRIFNSTFSDNTFLKHGWILYFTGPSPRLTVISSTFNNNNMGLGSLINSKSDNDIIFIASHITNNTGLETIYISSNSAKLVLDCTELNGNNVRNSIPAEKVVTTNLSECQSEIGIYTSNFNRAPNEGCMINDVTIGWENNEYLVEATNILQNIGIILLCAVATDVGFPVLIQYEIITENTQDASFVPFTERNPLYFQIQSGLQRKCIFRDISKSSASDNFKSIIAILHSTDPNVNITQPSVNITANNIISFSNTPTSDNGISSTGRSTMTYIIVVTFCTIIIALESITIIILCGIIIYCRSKTSSYQNLSEATNTNEVNVSTNDSYAPTLKAKSVDQNPSDPVYLNSFVDDPEDPLYDVPASD